MLRRSRRAEQALDRAGAHLARVLAAAPAVGDFVVVDNQNPGDVYAGSNRAAITSVTTPAPSDTGISGNSPVARP